MLETRALVRLCEDLLDERTGWLQRVHASLFHLGAPDIDVGAMSAAGRERLAAAKLSPATRTAVDVALRQVDRLTADMARVPRRAHPRPATPTRRRRNERGRRRGVSFGRIERVVAAESGSRRLAASRGLD